MDGFTAIGKVGLSLPLSLFRKLVYFLAVFLLPLFLGAEAAFFAEPVSDVLGPLVSALIYCLAIKKILYRKRGARGAGVRP